MNDHAGPRHRAPAARQAEPLASVLSFEDARLSRRESAAPDDPDGSLDEQQGGDPQARVADDGTATSPRFPASTGGPATAAAAVPEAVWTSRAPTSRPAMTVVAAPDPDVDPRSATRVRALVAVTVLLTLAVGVAALVWTMTRP